jgi:hypothetical protein
MTATASVIVRNRTPEDVAADLLAAKKLHEETKKLVLEHEQELIDMLGQPEEGSKTHRLQGFKVEVKGVINRKVDWDVFDMIIGDIERQEPFFSAPIKLKRELDETEVKRLAREQPGVYARLAKALTATPGKTGVTVSRTE